MEICDVFDQFGNFTGRTAERGTALAPGEFYLSVQVWIREKTGHYLIQQRAAHLSSGAGMWATTAGYVFAGEASQQGAIREVQEELGIRLPPQQLHHFARLVTETRLEDIWIVYLLDDSITPQPGSEVAAWQWASKKDMQQMIHAHVFFPYSYFATLPE